MNYGASESSQVWFGALLANNAYAAGFGHGQFLTGVSCRCAWGPSWRVRSTQEEQGNPIEVIGEERQNRTDRQRPSSVRCVNAPCLWWN